MTPKEYKKKKVDAREENVEEKWHIVSLIYFHSYSEPPQTSITQQRR